MTLARNRKLMHTMTSRSILGSVILLVSQSLGRAAAAELPQGGSDRNGAPAATNVQKVDAEIQAHYAKAHPEIQEYVRWTAATFGPNRMWLPMDAFAATPSKTREERTVYLATLFSEAEYGRHLCTALAEASAFKDKRLVPGLLKVAGFHQADVDYDCRAKWMAVAALARQESDEAVPLLISLVDHGNQNTRNWARAALSRQLGQDFKQDKRAWAQYWEGKGHPPVGEAFLKAYQKPGSTRK